MKKYDHIFTAIGIKTDFWMDAQSEPEILLYDKSSKLLILEISCWLKTEEDPMATATEAPYYVKITFTNSLGYQILQSESPHYDLEYGKYQNPPFMFQVNHDKFDSNKIMKRPEKWYPTVVNRDDTTNWFFEMDTWCPSNTKIDLPQDTNHYIVVGHDTFVEILSSSFTIESFTIF